MFISVKVIAEFKKIVRPGLLGPRDVVATSECKTTASHIIAE